MTTDRLLAPHGTRGYVYQYSLDVQVAENGAERTETYGSQAHPLSIAFDGPDNALLHVTAGYNPKAHYYDWDYGKRTWSPASQP